MLEVVTLRCWLLVCLGICQCGTGLDWDAFKNSKRIDIER